MSATWRAALPKVSHMIRRPSNASWPRRAEPRLPRILKPAISNKGTHHDHHDAVKIPARRLRRAGAWDVAAACFGRFHSRPARPRPYRHHRAGCEGGHRLLYRRDRVFACDVVLADLV